MLQNLLDPINNMICMNILIAAVKINKLTTPKVKIGSSFVLKIYSYINIDG